MYDYEDDYYSGARPGDYYDEEEARQSRRRRIFLTIIAILLVLILLSYFILPVIQALQPEPTSIPIRFTTPQPRI
ncbi:MAG: hypothetical protein RLP44_32260 [Aggregatilineales bacterium]